MEKLLRFEAESITAYTAADMVTDLKKGIWSELAARKPIDIYRRNLQKSFADRLLRLVTPAPTGITFISSGSGQAQTNSRNTDVVSIAKAQLRTLQAEIKAALPAFKDASSRAHLQDVADRISDALDNDK
jgi:hypothetical protein